MATKARKRIFDAINDSYGAALSTLDATEMRGHHATQALLREARKGEKELAALAEQWLDSPTNFFHNISALLGLQGRAEQRVLELGRDAFVGTRQYWQDVQQAMEHAIKANRAATDATVEALRATSRRAVRRLRPVEAAVRPRRRAATRRAPVAETRQVA